MLIGQLLCGMVLAALVSLGCVLLGIELWSSLILVILGANLGLGANLPRHLV